MEGRGGCEADISKCCLHTHRSWGALHGPGHRAGKGWRGLPLLVLCRQPTDLILTLYVKSVLLSSNTGQLFLSADYRGPCPSPRSLSLPSPSHVSLLGLCAQNPNVWAQKGHLCYLKRDFGEAKECYERTVSFVEDAADMHFVYLRLGSIYLEEKEVRSQQERWKRICHKANSRRFQTPGTRHHYL